LLLRDARRRVGCVEASFKAGSRRRDFVEFVDVNMEINIDSDWDHEVLQLLCARRPPPPQSKAGCAPAIYTPKTTNGSISTFIDSKFGNTDASTQFAVSSDRFRSWALVKEFAIEQVSRV
jgi:hypothetical protein